MHILIGIGLAVVLLYYWLIGHWFARVLAFLLIATVAGLLGASAGANLPFGQTYPVAAVHDEGSCAGKHDAFCEALRPRGPSPAPAPIPSPAVEIIGGLIGIALAWPISSIPIYVRRRQHA